MIIGFWQPIPGHGGSSVNCVSVASAMVLKHKLNCVVLQTHFSGNNLSHFLVGESNPDDVYNNSGIDGLFRMFKTGSGFEEIDSLANTFYGNPAVLDLIGGTMKSNPAIYRADFLDNFDKTFTTLNAKYDIVFVDIQAGSSEISRKALSRCDYVICGITQEYHLLYHLFKDYEMNMQKTVFLVGNYDPNLKLNYKNMLKKFKQFNSGNLLYLPRCIELANAINDSAAAKFFATYLGLTKRDKKKIAPDTAAFLAALDTVTDYIYTLVK